MTNQPGDLLDVQGITDPETVVQQNTEATARMLWKMEATYLSGAPNTIVGPPTSGARVLDEIWRDKHCALFICTTAGTPGSWKQVEPAVVDATTDVASPPTNYWIVERNATVKFTQKYWNGSAWVTI
jgi:hypothetical protein